MRIVMNIVAILSLLMGCVWVLQGINILPGSFMTGQTMIIDGGGTVGRG